MSNEASRWPVFLYTAVPALALLASWLSGFLETSSMEYGFPLPWKTLVAGWDCPPGPLGRACFLKPGVLLVYDWSFFALNTAFYLALGYAFVFAGSWAMGKSVSRRVLHPSN